MSKYFDKSPSEWDAIVDEWNNSDSNLSLREYMGLSEIDYLRYAHGLNDKSMTDEDVLLASKNITRDVVTELVIKPRIENVAMLLKNVV